MQGICVKKVLSSFENVYELLETLESVLNMLHSICLEKEIQAVYYNLQQENLLKLSQERNDNINMLQIAISKVKKLKIENQNIEDTIIKPQL